MSDIKNFLRKHEFPHSAREALFQLEQLCSSRNCGPQQQRLVQEIMDEYIFCETDRRGLRKNRLNSIQELQLLDVLTNYLESQGNEVLCNTIFLTLFHYEGSSCNYKMRILAKLLSLGIAAKSVVVLDCSAVWMQQQDCLSEVVVGLVRELVNDYFVLVPRVNASLQDLCQISPRFTVNFITAVTALYSNAPRRASKMGQCPDALLGLVTDWVTANDSLCLTSLVTNLNAALPRGSIIMPTVTPIPGLIHWCVTAAVAEGGASSPPPKDAWKRTLFSRLLLGVLETMTAAEKMRTLMIQKDVMLMRDVLTICEDAANLMGARCAAARGPVPDNVQEALDRLGQAVQVALVTGCLQGNIDELCKYLKKLPGNNRLIRMIILHASQ